MPKKDKIPDDADMRKAIDRNSLVSVQRIIDAGYDLTRRFVTDTMFDRDCVQKNALIWAVHLQREKIVRLLIESGADLNGRDRVKQTALHLAATQTSPKMMRILIAAGADVNAIHVGMQTPLHYAVDSEKPALCDILMEAGADPGFVPEAAKVLHKPGYLTPFQSAIDYGNLSMVEHLAHVGGPALFSGRTLDGRELVDLCGTDQLRQKLLALRTEITMTSAMPAGAAPGLVGMRKSLGLHPL